LIIYSIKYLMSTTLDCKDMHTNFTSRGLFPRRTVPFCLKLTICVLYNLLE